MIIGDFSKIKIGNTDISSVYMGTEKLWPRGGDTGSTGNRRIMRFTTADGNTWTKDYVAAYAADNRLIEPIEKTSTGWTYAEDVEYLASLGDDSIGKTYNLLTFNGFGTKIKIRRANKLFYWEENITEIDTKYFDVSEVADFTYMFGGCNNLVSLDVSNFDTSKAETMWGMFAGCVKLTSLNLSKWNTSNVVRMRDLFKGCNSLVSLDLSNWDTSKVQFMTGMFHGCSLLTSLNLSHFNTSNVRYINSMFAECGALTSLDLSNWNLANVTDINDLFFKCNVLKTITMKNCSQGTIDKIKAALKDEGILGNVQIIV